MVSELNSGKESLFSNKSFVIDEIPWEASFLGIPKIEQILKLFTRLFHKAFKPLISEDAKISNVKFEFSSFFINRYPGKINVYLWYYFTKKKPSTFSQYIPPNHLRLQVVPQHYHGDGSKLLCFCSYGSTKVENKV